MTAPLLRGNTEFDRYFANPANYLDRLRDLEQDFQHESVSTQRFLSRALSAAPNSTGPPQGSGPLRASANDDEGKAP